MNAAVFGIGASELLVVAMMMLGGGGLAGVGVPQPIEPGLESAAPADCLAYFSHQGIARPDPASTNHVERLTAEPAIGEFVAELNRLADEALKQVPPGDEQAQLAAKTLPVIVRTLLGRPSVLYIGSVVVSPDRPDGRAALVVHAGDEAAALREAILAWEKMYLEQLEPGAEATVTTAGTAEFRRLPMPPDVPPFVPPVVWGADGPYVYLTIGDGEAEDLVKRIAAKAGPAPWLKQLRADAAIPRPGDTLYVDVAGILKLADPYLDMASRGAPFDVRKVIDELGLRSIRYVSLTSGLDDSVAVAKVIVGHDENPKGALELFDEEPLTKADFAGIPKSADFAMLARLDGAASLKRFLGLVGAIEPRAVEEFERELGRGERELGFDLEDDLLAALGDRWTLYNSPSEGGSLLTGLVATASIRDRAKAEKVIDIVLKRIEEETRRGDRPSLVVKNITVGDKTIKFVQFLNDPVPVAPAWCLTDEQLVFAMSPQMVKTHLSRPADAPTLAEAPEVARQLASGDVTTLAYSDGRGAAALIYSYVQYLATMGSGALAKETGIVADISKFPPFTAIAPHLQPSTGVVRRGKTTLSLESYSVGPSLGPGTAAVGAGVMVPAVLGARTQARTVAAANNLRMLGIAALTYSFRDGKMMPRAITDADGKPLLSWRVALLPDLDQQPLYERFRLDEPWDSEHNKKLLAEMPSFYLHPSVLLDARAGKTVFQLPRGKGTLYDGDKTPDEADLNALPVGRGQTVLFVETAPAFAVEWTKPDDIELTPDTIFLRLMLQRGGGTNVAMNDGSILELSPAMGRELLEQMFFPRWNK